MRSSGLWSVRGRLGTKPVTGSWRSKVAGAVGWPASLAPAWDRPMAIVAIVILVTWFALVAGARGYLHYRRAGQVAAPVRVERGSAPWWARRIAGVGVLLAFAAPLAEPFVPWLGRLSDRRLGPDR